MHSTAQFLTCPDEDVLDHACEDPYDEADALDERQPAFFCQSSPRPSVSIHREPALL